MLAATASDPRGLRRILIDRPPTIPNDGHGLPRKIVMEKENTSFDPCSIPATQASNYVGKNADLASSKLRSTSLYKQQYLSQEIGH